MPGQTGVLGHGLLVGAALEVVERQSRRRRVGGQPPVVVTDRGQDAVQGGDQPFPRAGDDVGLVLLERP